MKKQNNTYAVILVGGKGKRLRPLSTNARPKAFLSVTADRKTMFRNAVDRVSRILPRSQILVMANRAHRALVTASLPGLSPHNLLLEPVSRNTGPAIALAALSLWKRNPDAVMVVLPADQYIENVPGYLSSLKKGIAFAQRGNDLVLMAVKPTYPATGFGYLKLRSSSRHRAVAIGKVEKFLEKPEIRTAERFLRDSSYFWNAGIFICRAGALLQSIKVWAPDIGEIIRSAPNDLSRIRYRAFPDISIDYAVMEKADNLYAVRGNFGWRDIGSFEALKEVLEKEGRSFTSVRGRITAIA
ncbi:MAG: mannose-1-phosphate guanylyltransferase [Candidatus Omnitrophota bacterium]